MLVCLPLWAATSGCYTLSLMQEPRPVPPEMGRGSIGLGFNTKNAYPSLHLAARVGLVPHVELRAKASVGSGDIIQSAQLGVNIELPIGRYQSLFYMPYARIDPQLSENKEPSTDFDDPMHHTRAFVAPMLFVQHVGAGDFFIGPEVQIGSRDERQFIGVGGHIGCSFAVASYGNITPEFGLLTIVNGTAPTMPRAAWQQPTLLQGDVIAEFGLSYSFGAAH